MEDVLAVRDEYRLQGWAEIIRERQASGLTNKEFCAQRGITEKTYYYWLRKVREAAAETVAPQLVRLEERGEGERAHRIEIRYGEAELKLPEDVDLRAVSGCVGQGTVPCPSLFFILPAPLRVAAEQAHQRFSRCGWRRSVRHRPFCRYKALLPGANAPKADGL